MYSTLVRVRQSPDFSHQLTSNSVQRSILTRELNQVDDMRNNLMALAKSLEDDVVHHYVSYDSL